MNGKHSSWVKHIRMLLVAGGGAAIITAFWYIVFFRNHINAGREDETVVTNGLLQLIGLFHGLIANTVLSETLKKRRLVQECIESHDEKRFRKCVTNRIPGTTNLLLAVLSLNLIAAVMLVEYRNPWIGGFAVQSIGFILLVYWQVATNLDDPLKGIWYVGELAIPKEWLQEKQPSDNPPPP